MRDFTFGQQVARAVRGASVLQGTKVRGVSRRTRAVEQDRSTVMAIPGEAVALMKRHRSSGHTLIELMMTMAIFGIIAAMSVLGVSSFIRSSRLAGASNALMVDLHYARMLASSRQSTYQIRFSPSSYRLVRVTPASTLLTRQLPLGTTCAATDTATFYPWGLADSIQVTVTNSGHTSILKVGANGRVTHG
jgi:prepilin-type N-terminal cleavage/methylation domain-containing protein